MKPKHIIICAFLLIFINSFSQKFSLGEKLLPTSSKFKLLGISSETLVETYQYIGTMTDIYFYNRRIGEILICLKNGMIVNTIYNLIPEEEDVDVPQSLINLVQQSSPIQLVNKNKIWAVRVNNETISIGRANNALTLNKDRILFMSSLKK